MEKKISCFKLTAGDVIRYSNNSLIEVFSECNGSYYSLEKLVQEETYFVELACRLKSQAISSYTFEMIRNKILKGILSANSTNNDVHCFHVSGANTTKYSNGCCIDSVRLNEYMSSIERKTLPPIFFDSFLSSCTRQYKIEESTFSKKFNLCRKLLDANIKNVENRVASKAQIELF
jgi:hypothetical protein